MDRAEIERLIGQVDLGNREAFSALYDATSGKLYAVCARVLGQGPGAEDAMHDVYIKVWRHAGRYQVTGHSPMTWLITIARNTAIDRLRARKVTTDLGEESDRISDSGPTPEEAALRASDARALYDCLKTLPEDRAAAIQGAYLKGETYQTLADRFAVPLNTMRTWLRRGLIKLRECLEP